MLPDGSNLQQSLSDWQRHANSCRLIYKLASLYGQHVTINLFVYAEHNLSTVSLFAIANLT